MMDALPESLAAGSPQFAGKIGSASLYESDPVFSAGLVNTWDGGIGRNLSEEGFYYAEANTLRHEAMLPPLRRFTQLPDLDLEESTDTHPLSNRCHWVEAAGRVFVCKGRFLYEWQEDLQRFVRRLYISFITTSMAYFDGYLHIAGKLEVEPFNRLYCFVRIDDFSYGFTTPPGKFSQPLIFHVFGGILYAVEENRIYYSAGAGDYSGAYPPIPSDWSWTDPISIGYYNDPITGIAGLMYQELGQRYLYVSTQSHLFAILPGDVPFGLTAWPTSDVRNGVGMKAFYNKIFIPVGGDLLALQGNGDMLGAGVDNNNYGLPINRAGEHYDIATAPNFPFCTIRASAGQSTVWANKASGWHYVTKLPTNTDPNGTFYSATFNRLFVGTATGTVMHCYLGNTTRDPRYDNAYRYEPNGVIDLGWYSGGLVEQAKYWHSAFCDAGYLNSDTSVTLIYLADDDDKDSFLTQADYGNWNVAGTITDQVQELLIADCRLAAKRFRLAALLQTTDPTVTPTVRAMGLRYTPKLLTRRRWSITATLPAECLRDATGAEIEDYDQEEWQEWLKYIEDQEVPVSFTDIDNRSYRVLVTGSSTRTYNVSCIDDAFSYDIDWSLALLEMCGD